MEVVVIVLVVTAGLDRFGQDTGHVLAFICL